MAQRLDQIPDTPQDKPIRLSDIPDEPVRLSDIPDDKETTLVGAAASVGRDVLATGEALARAAAGGIGTIYGGVIAAPLMAQEALEGGEPLEAGKAVVEGFTDLFTWNPYFSQTPRIERDLGHAMEWLREWSGYSGEAAAGIASRTIPGMGGFGTEEGQRLAQTISEASFDAIMLGTLLLPFSKGKPVSKGGGNEPPLLDPSPSLVDSLVAATVKRTPEMRAGTPDTRFYTTMEEARQARMQGERLTGNEPLATIERTQEGGTGRFFGPEKEPTPFSRAVLPDEKAAALEALQPGLERQLGLALVPKETPQTPHGGWRASEPRQMELPFERTYFDEGIEALQKPGFMRTAEEVRAAAFAENEVKRISNVLSRGQGGAIDLSVLKEVMDKAVRGTLNFFRSNGKEGKPSSLPPASHYEDYFSLPDEYQRATRNDLPLNRVVTEITAREVGGRKMEDLPPMLKGLWTNATIARLYDNLLSKWVIDKINEITKLYDRLGEAIAIDERFQKGYGVTALRYFRRTKAGYFGAMENLPVRSRVKVLNTILSFDDAQVLKDAGLQWPTIEMLKQKGLNDAEIRAYQEHAKFEDHMYDLTNYGRALGGLKPVARIPGYMHHAYRGDFAIRIIDKDTGKVVYFTRAYTKTGANWAANRVIRKLAERENLTNLASKVSRMERPTSVGAMIAAFEETLGTLNRNDKRTKLIEAYFLGIKGRMSQGLLTSSLDRHGIRGWIGDDGVNRFNYHKVLKMQDNYRMEVIEYVKNMEILNSVAKPLEAYRDQLSKYKNTWEYVQHLIDKSIGKPVNHLEVFDKFVKRGLDFVTRENFGTQAPNNVIHFFRNIFTNLTIGFFKVPFLAANYVQPWMYGLNTLALEWSRIGRGAPIAAYAKTLLKEAVAPSKENLEAIEWAVKNREIRPTLVEATGFVKGVRDFFAANFMTGRMTASAIEGIGWLKSFIMMLEYYRSTGLPEARARAAAADAAKHIMVNYSVADRPHMFTNFGIAGEAISPFATFRNNQYGSLALALRAIKENPGLIRKMTPILAFTGTSIFMAGLRGIIGINEVEAIIRLINSIYQWGTGEPDKLLDFSVTGTLMEHGFGDFWLFGGMSSATKAVPGMEKGIDLGGPSSAPEVSSLIAAPGLSFMFNVGIDIGILAKMAAGTATDAEKMRFWLDVVPSQQEGFVEWAFTEEGMPVPDVWAKGKGSVRRDEEDWRARQLFGTKTLTEAREREVYKTVRREESTLRDVKNQTLNMATDYVMRGEPIPHDLVMAAVKEGMLPTEFIQSVLENVKTRRMTGLEKQRSGSEMTLNRIRRIQRIEELSGEPEE